MADRSPQEKAAHEFGSYNFQSLMSCKDDMTVAATGPGQQSLSSCWGFEKPGTMGALFPGQAASICIDGSAWLTRGCSAQALSTDHFEMAEVTGFR